MVEQGHCTLGTVNGDVAGLVQPHTNKSATETGSDDRGVVSGREFSGGDSSGA
jgi:hypothetical protein